MTVSRIPSQATGGQSLDVRQLQLQHRQGAYASAVGGKKVQGTFADLLKTKVGGLTFSAHATTRMSSRKTEMSPEQMGKLEKAVDGAAQKGARESLVVMKNCAFIVNIPNRTVVTAMDGESLKQNIFTNIDSAVLSD